MKVTAQKAQADDNVLFVSNHYVEHTSGMIYRVSLASFIEGELVEMQIVRMHRDDVPVQHKQLISKGF